MANRKRITGIENLDYTTIKAELCKRSLKEFIQLFWNVIVPNKPLIWNWHHDCFVVHLEALHKREIRNLLINLPPGTTKSTIFSILFPAWVWANEPSIKFLTASHNKDLTSRDAITGRDLLTSDLYRKCYPHIELSTSANKKDHFENTGKGCRTATAVGAGIQGWKGDFLILDDPHSAEEATSEVKRQLTINWFQSGFYNRLNDFNNGCRLVIGQRIARDDLSAYILNTYKHFEHINIPWDYKPTSYVTSIGWSDPREQEGEQLCTALIPERELAGYRSNARTWQAQWQQNPINIETAMFKLEDFRYYEETEEAYRLGDKTLSKDCTIRIASVDIASNEGKRNDYSVVTIADIAKDGNIMLVNLWRKKVNAVDFIPALQSLYTSFKPKYVLMEKAGMANLLISQVIEKGILVRTVYPEKNKEARALPMQLRFEMHQIHFPHNAKWLPELQNELIEFPESSHDDIVDSLSMLVNEAGKYIVKGWQEQPKETEQERVRRLEYERKQYLQQAMLEGIR